MPKSTPIKFQTSLIALSVLSLSACSSLPTASDIGGGLATAGKATANATRKTWNTTTYLLGFSDSRDGGSEATDDDQLLAQNNSTALNRDTNSINNADGLLPIASEDVIERQEFTELSVVESPVAEPLQSDSEAPAVLSNDTVSLDDQMYEVGEGQTLWEIARSTTGDATNWHIIADVNDLEQNAAVFPGQELIIPGELTRDDNAPPVSDVIADAQNTNTEDALSTNGGGTRLSLPEPGAAIADATSDAESPELASAAPADSLPATGQNAVAFELEDGETLWNLAKRSTGDATNWQAIATQNEFTEKQAVTVRPGQTIYVPQALVQTSVAQAGGNNDINVASSEPVNETASEPLNEDVSEGVAVITAPVETAAESTAAELSDAASDEITALSEGSTQVAAVDESAFATDNALDANTDTLAASDVAENSNIPAVVMVSGTYFPKAVYNDADFSSSLLMRVPPGTTLQVSGATGPWFEVETDEGVGYVHERDIQ